MRAGFLGSSVKTRQAQNPSGPGKEAAGKGSTPAAKPEPSPSPSVQLSDEQWARNFDQCLQLLGSPTDETRFVGLLLATKLLPQGGDDALRRVLAAIGWPFIQRLLLPLGIRKRSEDSTRPPVSEEQLQQQVMCAGVGLSMLAGLCRLPEVASGPELRQLLPCITAVVSAGSISAALDPSQQDSVPTQPNTQAAPVDWPVIEESLECLHAACSCPDLNTVQHACQELIAAGLLAAVSRVLTQLLSTSARHKWSPRVLGVANVWRIPALSVQLIRDLTGSLPAQAWQDAATQAAGLGLIPALAHLIGLPEVLDSAAASTAATQSRKRAAQAAHAAQQQKQQQQEQQEVGSTEQQQQASQPAQGADSAGDASGASAAELVQEDAALVQLQSLYALLLILQHLGTTSLAGQQHVSQQHVSQQHVSQQLAALRSTAPARPPAPAQQSSAAAQMGTYPDGWGAAATRGLCWVLRGRVGLSVKHTALQLCASLVDLVGPTWLIMHQPDEQPQAATQTSPHFAKVLSETLQVELGLLLRDALHEGEVLPSGTEAPQPSDALLKELAESRERAEQAAASIGPATALLSSLNQTVTGPQQQQPRPSVTRPTSSATRPRQTPDPSSQTAGQRASQLLPAVLLLLEQLIEVLAQQAALDDEDDDDGAGLDDDDHVDPGQAMQVESAAHTALPRLPLHLQHTLIMSLSSSVKLVVQFMRSVGELQGLVAAAADEDAAGDTQMDAGAGSSSAHAAGLPPLEVRLACTRLVGRYIAEVPDAVDDDLLAVLPAMLSCDAPDVASGMVSGEEGSQMQALDFLLPGLLQVSSTSTGSMAMALRRSVLAPTSSPVLHSICEYTATAAQQAAACCSAGAAAAVQGVQVERRLADVCMLCLNLLGPVNEVLTDGQAAVLVALRSAVPHIAAWAGVRVKEVCDGSVGVPSGSGLQVARAVTMRMVQAQLMPRVLLCAAAWVACVLQQGVQAGDQGVLAECSDHLMLLVAAGVRMGYQLCVACVLEEEQPGLLRQGLPVPSTQGPQLDMHQLLVDVPGDGERCWDLLLQSSAALVHALPALPGMLHGLGRSPAAQRDTYQVAADEVEMEHVALQLLLSRL